MISNSKWHRQFSFSLPLFFPLNLPVLPNRKWAGKKRKRDASWNSHMRSPLMPLYSSCLFQPCMCIIISRPNMCSICFVAAQLAPDHESRFYLPSTTCSNNVKLMGILLVNFIHYSGNFIAIAGIIMRPRACVHQEDGNWYDWYDIPLKRLRSERESLLDQQLDLFYEHVS